MRRIIMVNAITVSRIILTTLLVLGLTRWGISFAGLSVMVFLIYISDYVDGKLARWLSAVSKAGAVLDVAADLYFIESMTVVCVSYGMLPVWYPLLIAAKFAEFMITSGYLKRKQGSGEVFISDKVGRWTAVMFYALPYLSISIFGVLSPSIAFSVMKLLCAVIAASAIASSVLRAKACICRYAIPMKRTDWKAS